MLNAPDYVLRFPNVDSSSPLLAEKSVNSTCKGATMVAMTRKRDLTFRSSSGLQTQTSLPSGSKTFTPQPLSIVGKQETVSETNVGWLLAERLRDDKDYLPYISKEQRLHLQHFDWGSNFTTKRNFYKENGKESKDPTFYYVRDVPGGATDFEYLGPLSARSNSVSPISTLWPVLSYPDEALITTLGATAIARCIPTNPVSDVMVFLGELKNDGLPHIIGSSAFRDRALKFKNLGDEYLNVEFGWKPFISDIKKFAYASHNSEAIIKQYIRDSGHGVRRTYKFPTVTTTEVTDLTPGLPAPSLVTSYYRNGATLMPRQKTRVTTVDYWFSGCFTYHLHLGSSSEEKMALHAQLARKLAGLELTPEVLWELAPWSWAVDWAVNMGDILHNFAAFAQDGLVMKYGYMMAHSVIEDTYTIGETAYQNRSIGPLSQTFGTDIKVRRKATPFGFGLSSGGFSTRQWAILAALGLSRSGRQL